MEVYRVLKGKCEKLKAALANLMQRHPNGKGTNQMHILLCWLTSMHKMAEDGLWLIVFSSNNHVDVLI